MNKEERLKDYLEGYNSQYQFIGEDKIEHSLDNDIKELIQENKQLKDNWNKLREWVFGEKMMFYNGGDGSRLIRYNELCNKMQELESGDSND